ncbi:MAG: lipoprotein insertase outer membrane protein LolB [Pannonibacter indicus]
MIARLTAAAALALGLLAGCATLPSPPLPARDALRDFLLESRFALRATPPGQATQSSGGRLTWSHRAHHDRILLANPLGYGVAEINSTPDGARLRTADGEEQSSPDPESLIEAVTGQGVAILAEENLVTYGIIAAGLWPQIAYVMILYLTGLNNVAPDQIEAARLDGAKGWKMLWYVILPQLRPATFIAVIVTVIGALRSFDLVSIMTSGGPFGSSRVLSFYMYEQALSEYGFRMGYGAAIAVVLFAIMMIFISGFIWKMWRDEKEH